MRIVLTGIAGLLGKALFDLLSEKNEVIGIVNRNIFTGTETYQLDISDYSKTYDTITRLNPDVVIHCAALSNVDGCEKDPDLAFKINAIGTRNLALACQRFDAAMLYVSTDYVFSGKDNPQDGYKEFDKPDPVSQYARTKLYGEWYIQNLVNKFYIVRTSWLFGENRPNYLTDMAKNLSENKPVKQCFDMVSSPTLVTDLSQAVSELISSSRYGIYHLSNGGFVSRYDLALHIAGLLGAAGSLIQRIRLDDLRLAAKRPSFSGLNNYVWKTEGFKELRPWQEAVGGFLEKILKKDLI